MSAKSRVRAFFIEPLPAGVVLLRWRREIDGRAVVTVWQEFPTRDAAKQWAAHLAEDGPIAWAEALA